MVKCVGLLIDTSVALEWCDKTLLQREKETKTEEPLRDINKHIPQHRTDTFPLPHSLLAVARRANDAR